MDAVLKMLTSEDAFERLEGERRLRVKAARDFGYRWDGSPEARQRALDRVKAWREERRRRASRTAAAAGPGLAAFDLSELKGLPPAEVEEKLRALLEQAKLGGNVLLGRRPCEECRKRPATVQVTAPRPDEDPEVRHFCDPCAVLRGEIRG